MFRCKLCSFRDVKEQYLGILLDQNVNKHDRHNRDEEKFRDQRTQSAQTQPEQVDGDVQINLTSRYTLHVDNVGLILLIAYYSLIKMSKSQKDNEEILIVLISLKIVHRGSIEM